VAVLSYSALRRQEAADGGAAQYRRAAGFDRDQIGSASSKDAAVGKAPSEQVWQYEALAEKAYDDMYDSALAGGLLQRSQGFLRLRHRSARERRACRKKRNAQQAAQALQAGVPSEFSAFKRANPPLSRPLLARARPLSYSPRRPDSTIMIRTSLRSSKSRLALSSAPIILAQAPTPRDQGHQRQWPAAVLADIAPAFQAATRPTPCVTITETARSGSAFLGGARYDVIAFRRPTKRGRAGQARPYRRELHGPSPFVSISAFWPCVGAAQARRELGRGAQALTAYEFHPDHRPCDRRHQRACIS